MALLMSNRVCAAAVAISRYVEGHMLQHAQAHQAPSGTPSDAAGSSSTGTYADGAAAVAISMADFSAWCFACDSYVTDPAIEEVLSAFRAAKFGGGSGSSAAAGSSS